MKAAACALLALAIVGCGKSSTATHAVPSTSVPPSTGSTATTIKHPKTAADVVAALKSVVPTVTETTVYDARSDPNELLGRPGQYTSKAGFHDSRVANKPTADDASFSVDKGGDVEIWPTEASAKQRADYINGIVNSAGSRMLAEPEYIYPAGTVLLRVSGGLTPDEAAAYARALKTALG